MPATKNETRLYFMDDLRAAMIFLVTAFHAAIAFMDKAPQWWYINSQRHSQGFTLFVITADVFMMPLIFFISGYLARASLLRSGPARFAARRLLRLGPPWALCVLLFAPPLAYITALNYGYNQGFAWFLRHGFTGEFYSQGPYWFLGVLLVFSCAAAVLPSASGDGEVRPGRLLGAAAAVSAAGMFCSTLYFPADSWGGLGKLLVFQPARLAGYAAWFWLGLRAARHGWFKPGGYRPGLPFWAAATAAAWLGWVAVKASFPSPAGAGQCLIYAAAHTAFCFSACLALLAAAARRPGAAERPLLPPALADTSFGVYLLHLPLLTLLAVYLVTPAAPAAAQWAALTVAAAASAAAAAAALGKVPYIGKFIR